MSKFSQFIGKALRVPWYAVWKLVERSFYQGQEYVLQVPSGHLVYAPWYSTTSEFADLISETRRSGPLIVSLDRCYMIYQFCRYAIALQGDMIECGTYTGGTAYLIASIIRKYKTSKTLHLFDTFQGMPDIAKPDRDAHRPGDFGDTSLEYVQNRLRHFEFIEFHPGLIPNTFSEIENLNCISFVHVDVDLYPTALECCRYLWPRLTRGGVMLFDDYGFLSYRRAIRAAVDESFQGAKANLIILPTAQAVAIKT